MDPFLDSFLNRVDSSGVVSAVDSILPSKAAPESVSCDLSFNFFLAAGDCVLEIENLMAFSKVMSSTFESFQGLI